MLKRYFSLFITISLLITSVTLAIVPMAKAQTPTIFIDPSTVVGNLTPAPSTATQWKINVTDIGGLGMIGHEFNLAIDPQVFPDHKPITNGNFTADASGWTPLPTITRGTATYGYYATDGNPSPGSGPGSYRMRANSTASQTASITYLLEQPFTWTIGTPVESGALVSYAYTISGNSFGTASAGAVSVGIRVIKPDGTSVGTLFTAKTFTSARPWSYNFSVAGTAALNQRGTYKFQLRSVLTTAAVGATNYVEIKWDDVGLQLAPVAASEGPFLTSDPRNVGKTIWSAKYMRYPTNTSLYVSDTLTGEPYTAVWPVYGGGMIANITLIVDYGATNLDLWGTQLLETGLQPPYTPTPMDHIAIDAYFDNRIPGDITGPENPPGSGLYPYDRKVDGYDLIYLGKKFGTTDPVADFTGPENPVGSGFYPPDGTVDGRDLIALGKNFGAHYP